jgi:hypothetical protein
VQPTEEMDGIDEKLKRLEMKKQRSMDQWSISHNYVLEKRDEIAIQ